ncbi:MAG: GNAT family N-acetyltransferase [Bradyrhizobium sp.]|nr:MAG: GNAT family N-acetyltransferase [Bradyrhizobium sp.]
MAEIRPYRSEDLDALYRIALATGAGGCDASAIYQDPKLVGHVFAAPYALFSPETVRMAEDAEGVAGYIVGAANTPDFEKLLEARWWPTLRPIYPDPPSALRESGSRDQFMRHLIHEPDRAPKNLVEAYPAHLHINLLPRLRGKGFGRRLMNHWLDLVHSLGARGAHLSVGAANARAIRFYRAVGFREFKVSTAPAPKALWFVIDLPRAAHCL